MAIFCATTHDSEVRFDNSVTARHDWRVVEDPAPDSPVQQLVLRIGCTKHQDESRRAQNAVAQVVQVGYWCNPNGRPVDDGAKEGGAPLTTAGRLIEPQLMDEGPRARGRGSGLSMLSTPGGGH
eukprot:scaffold274764_cov30-Tisochrysis_lutea.AAC.1